MLNHLIFRQQKSLLIRLLPALKRAKKPSNFPSTVVFQMVYVLLIEVLNTFSLNLFITIFVLLFPRSFGLPLVNKPRFRLPITLDLNLLLTSLILTFIAHYVPAHMSELELRQRQLKNISIDRFETLPPYMRIILLPTCVASLSLLRAMSAERRPLARFAMKNGCYRDRITLATGSQNVNKLLAFVFIYQFNIVGIDADLRLWEKTKRLLKFSLVQNKLVTGFFHTFYYYQFS